MPPCSPSDDVPHVVRPVPSRAYVAMLAAEADERLDRLLRDLARLEQLLGTHDPHGHPAAWVRRVRRDLVARDAGALDRLLGAYAGAGSFSDLVLRDAPMDELDALRSRVWRDATALRDDLRHG